MLPDDSILISRMEIYVFNVETSRPEVCIGEAPVQIGATDDSGR
jgi:hypothetical protein